MEENMNSYKIGKDVQELRQRIERLESGSSSEPPNFTPFELANFEQSLSISSITLERAATGEAGILYFDNDWNLGEGKFRWPGRDSRRGKRNQVKIDWGGHLATCFLAEFTNLNNDYWALPGYSISLYKNDVFQKEITIAVAKVKDEDFGDEPTVRYKTRSRGFSDDIDKVTVNRSVNWSYREPPPP